MIKIPKFETIFFLVINGQHFHCYSCTSLDVDQIINEVQDLNWKQWLENVRFASKTPNCYDPFKVTRIK